MSAPGNSRLTLVVCGGLCALFAAVAWAAVSGKSATTDEPSHAVTGWFNLYTHDYRISPDVPTLWEEWVALPIGRDAIHFDPASPEYRSIRIRKDLTAWDVRTMYRTPGVDAIAIVRRSRAMALILAVALAALIGWWAWQLGGSVCAITATTLYCLDPNFLGHGALVKNDVAITLAYLGGAYALWRAGIHLTWRTALAVIVTSILAIGTKFSGILLAPVAIVVLGIRALNSEPWPMFGRMVAARGRKVLAVAVLAMVTIVCNYAAIWAQDDFRFDPGPDGLQLDSSRFVEILRYVSAFNDNHNHPPTAEQLAAWTPPASTRALLFAEQRHLLPQAFIDGLIMTQSGSESRLCYLAGQFYNGGKWYYFPVAAFFKAPLATIIAAILALWIGVGALRRGMLASTESRWAAIALFVPAAMYAMVAITSNVNIGLRHSFPVYPFVFIGIGLAVARVWPVARAARVAIVLLAIGLFVETAAAYPNYINFFSIAVGGPKAGFNLLSDSNLDWGQDLPALAAWQKKNPDAPLYLDYFGRCDPAAYGIHYFNLPGGYEYGPDPQVPSGPCVIAVSSTYLRLLQAYANPPDWFKLIKNKQPEEVLNGTIYVYRVGSLLPAQSDRS